MPVHSFSRLCMPVAVTEALGRPARLIVLSNVLCGARTLRSHPTYRSILC